MIYLLILLLIIMGYYTFTYGLYILRDENNKLAAVGTFLLAFISTITPIVILIMKY